MTKDINGPHGVATGISKKKVKAGLPGLGRKDFAHNTAMFTLPNGFIIKAFVNIPGMLYEGDVLIAERVLQDMNLHDSWSCRIMGGTVRGRVIVTKAHLDEKPLLTFVVTPSTAYHVDHARRLCALRVHYPDMGWRWYVPWWRRSGVCIEQSLMQWELFVDDPSRPARWRPGPVGLVYNPSRIICGLE